MCQRNVYHRTSLVFRYSLFPKLEIGGTEWTDDVLEIMIETSRSRLSKF